MRFIDQLTQTTNWQREVPNDVFSGIQIRFAGTNNAGQTLAAGDIGNFWLMLNGKQKGYIPTGFLSVLNNILWGYPEGSSTAGAAFAFTLFIPFYYPGFPNAITIGPADKMVLGLDVDATTIATKVASWTIEISGELSNWPERYFPEFRPFNETPGGAGTVPSKIKFENVFRVWINSSVVSNVMATRDGKVWHQSSYNALLAETSRRHQVEGSLITWGELAFGDSIFDFLSKNIEVQNQASGAGTIYQMLLVINLDTSRQNASYRVLVAQKTARLAEVQQQDVQAIQKVVAKADSVQ